MHAEAMAFVARAIRELGPFPTVIEIGGRDINGSVRPLFDGSTSYCSLDVRPGAGVDVVADARTASVTGLVDCVVCTEVLEHVEHAHRLVRNVSTWLFSGGVFIATMACDPRAPHSAVDELPIRPDEYYRNIDVGELWLWLRLAGMWPVLFEADCTRGDLYVAARRP